MVFFQFVPCYELMQVAGKPSSFGVWSILAGSIVVLFGRVRSILAGISGRFIWAGSVHFGGFSPT
jgi:multisubunit Na+/H+ antiporter MnhG subunit